MCASDHATPKLSERRALAPQSFCTPSGVSPQHLHPVSKEGSSFSPQPIERHATPLRRVRLGRLVLRRSSSNREPSARAKRRAREHKQRTWAPFHVRRGPYYVDGSGAHRLPRLREGHGYSPAHVQLRQRRQQRAHSHRRGVRQPAAAAQLQATQLRGASQ